jgi:hypothetical protein
MLHRIIVLVRFTNDTCDAEIGMASAAHDLSGALRRQA